jgi:hypothetical protein
MQVSSLTIKKEEEEEEAGALLWVYKGSVVGALLLLAYGTDCSWTYFTISSPRKEHPSPLLTSAGTWFLCSCKEAAQSVRGFGEILLEVRLKEEGK